MQARVYPHVVFCINKEYTWYLSSYPSLTASVCFYIYTIQNTSMAQLPDLVSCGIPKIAKICRFKLVLLGEEAVGKTSLSAKFVKDEFPEGTDVARMFGPCFLTRTFEQDEARVTFDIWDTAGQERYRSVAPMYYRGAQAALVVYDITSKSSFRGAKIWVDKVKAENNNKTVIAIAGNKADLDLIREVEYEQASELCGKKRYTVHGNVRHDGF